MTLNRWIVPLLAATFGIGACDAGEAPAPDATPATETEDSVEETALTPGTLAPINQSQVRGEVRVTGGGEDLRVVIEAESLQPEMEYEAYLHEGTCAQGGPVAAPLGSMTADEAGNGTLEASEVSGTRESSADAPSDSGMFVQIHDADDEPIACANVSSEDQPTEDQRS